MTKTSYTTEYHRYTQTTPCAFPATCDRSWHWEPCGTEFKTLEDAREYRQTDDAPALRIIKVTITVEREPVEILD